jgi:hypothetical protein
MARTTIDLDGSVLRELKRLARVSGRTLGEVASELLALALRSERQPEPKLVWKTKRMHARVDLEDKEAVHRALDER